MNHHHGSLSEHSGAIGGRPSPTRTVPLQRPRQWHKLTEVKVGSSKRSDMSRKNFYLGGSSVTGLLVALVLLGHQLIPTLGLAPSRVGVRGKTSTATDLQAASLPLLDTYAGDAWTRSARKNRIDRVLEHARDHQRRREGRSRGPATLARKKTEQQMASRYHNTVEEIATRTASLPFTLPELTRDQLLKIERGEIVMEQSEMGLQGSGFVVQDIKGADEAAVWEALLDFDGYANMIHTVRAGRVRDTRTESGAVARDGATYGIPSTTRASFDVSKFHLTISCIFKYHPEDHYMELSLDNALQNSALQTARGFWVTKEFRVKDNTPTTRVWLLCDLTLSPWLPKFIVDTAAASAMPRASTWLRPAVQSKSAEGVLHSVPMRR